jgi:hypothetical protein
MEKEITIVVEAPVGCTDEQFREWVYFCLHYMGSISNENPLSDYDLEAKDVTIY